MHIKLYYFKPELINENLKIESETLIKKIKLISSSLVKDRFLHTSKTTKSLSFAIKDELSIIMKENGFSSNKNIFASSDYSSIKRFTFDYYKSHINFEIGFNHEMACAWKLIKGSLLSYEDSQIGFKSKLSIIITVTKAMRDEGGFDGSIASFEKYIEYLKPMYNNLLNPIILIGIEPFEDFKISHKKYYDKTLGKVENK